MDEEEINQWYEDEKQNLFDEFTAKLETTKDKDKENEKFNAKMERLNINYNKKMETALRRKSPVNSIPKKIAQLFSFGFGKK